MTSRVVMTANHIRNARRLLRVTLPQLAEETGLSQSMAERFQNGEGPVKGMIDNVEAVRTFFLKRGVVFLENDVVVKPQKRVTANTVFEIRMLTGTTPEIFSRFSGLSVETIGAIERGDLLLADEPPHNITIQQVVTAAKMHRVNLIDVPGTDDMPTYNEYPAYLISEVTLRRLWTEASAWLQQFKEEFIPWSAHGENPATMVRPGLVRLVAPSAGTAPSVRRAKRAATTNLTGNTAS